MGRNKCKIPSYFTCDCQNSDFFALFNSNSGTVWRSSVSTIDRIDNNPIIEKHKKNTKLLAAWKSCKKPLKRQLPVVTRIKVESYDQNMAIATADRPILPELRKSQVSNALHNPKDDKFSMLGMKIKPDPDVKEVVTHAERFPRKAKDKTKVSTAENDKNSPIAVQNREGGTISLPATKMNTILGGQSEVTERFTRKAMVPVRRLTRRTLSSGYASEETETISLPKMDIRIESPQSNGARVMCTTSLAKSQHIDSFPLPIVDIRIEPQREATATSSKVIKLSTIFVEIKNHDKK